MSIVIVGLGPGDPTLITRAAWDVLGSADEIYVRTREHPAVSALPSDRMHDFDHVYASAPDFTTVYETIAQEIVSLGERPQGVIYAVPGHPCVGEQTTARIRALAQERGIPVEIVGGLSFLEPLFEVLALDPLEAEGFQIIDAMVVAQNPYPCFNPSLPAFIAQCYSRPLASDVKLTLSAAFPDDHPVTIISGAGTASQRVDTVPLAQLDHTASYDYLTTLYLPPLPPGSSLEELQNVLAQLRAPDGCPWDRQQTHETLRPYLLEEAYEVLEALHHDDMDALREELGDLMLQIVFHTQIATESGAFRLPEVLRSIVRKLWRRHPHVFGDVTVNGVDDVLRNWDAIKAAEKGDRQKEEDPLTGIPKTLPALARAQAYLRRGAKLGLKIDKPATEWTSQTPTPDSAEAAERWLGEALLSLAQWANEHDIDAETALHAACTQLGDEIRARAAQHEH